MDRAPHSPPAPTRVVGLRYDPQAGLPQVILKGAGPLAEELLQRREERRSPAVVHNPTLLQALYRLPIDCSIGPELFHAVAAILAHVLSVDAALARDFETRKENHG
ncbi:MAG: EscU/YscU/HrcU family type III secretion system export apparatus switch protein [Rhizobacter sp.]